MRAIKYLLVAVTVTLSAAGCSDDDTTVEPDAGDGVDGAVTAPDATVLADTCGAMVYRSGEIPPDEYGQPWPGVTVAFNRPDGSLIGTATADFDGMATRNDCVADTTLTAAYPVEIFNGGFEAFFRLETIMGVQIGQTVTLGEPGRLDDFVSVAVVNSAPPALNNVTQVCAQACGDGPVCREYEEVAAVAGEVPLNTVQTMNLGIYEDCLDSAGTFDVLLSAKSNGEIVQWAWVTGTTPAANEANTPVNNTSWDNTAIVTGEFTVNDQPQLAIGANLFLSWFRSGQSFNGFGPPVGLPSPGDSESADYTTVPAAFASSMVYQMAVFFDQGGLSAQCGAKAPTTAALAINLKDDLLPRVGFVANATNPSMPLIQWLADGSLADATLGVAQIEFDEEVVNVSYNHHQWTVVFPGATTSPVSLPVLPDNLLPYGPNDDSIYRETEGAFYELSTANYAGLIGTYPLQPAYMIYGEAPCDGDLPVEGIARVTSSRSGI